MHHNLVSYVKAANEPALKDIEAAFASQIKGHVCMYVCVCTHSYVCMYWRMGFKCM